MSSLDSRFEMSETEWEYLQKSGFYRINDLNGTASTLAGKICASLYAVLFLFGLISNAYVLRTLITVVRHKAKTVTKTGGGVGGASVNTSILINLISLCVVDTLVIAALPLTILDVGSGTWLLPASWCSVYWIAEIMNKILTSIISASLSLTSYFSVCRFNITGVYKKSIVAALILAIGFGITCWQAKMAMVYSDKFYVGYSLVNDTINVATRKCLFHPNDDQDTIKFTISTIFCGYILPICVMLSCYAAIVLKVFQQSRNANNNGRGSIRFRRTITCVVTLIIFYFCTWTPYWVVVITLSLVMNQDVSSQNNISQFAMFIHVLPFFNSAFAPLIYVLLNQTVRSQYKAIRINSARREIDTRRIPMVRSENMISNQHASTRCARSV